MRYVLPMLFLVVTPAIADDATIEAVKAASDGDVWRFDVTVRHGDTGWDDYADGWRVVAEDGTVLGTRELLHPHENEQPFTRSLSGVVIDKATPHVFLEVRTNADGWGSQRYKVDLH